MFIPVGSSLFQVWYPSSGADPFKQEDFLQVRTYFSRALLILSFIFYDQVLGVIKSLFSSKELFYHLPD